MNLNKYKRSCLFKSLSSSGHSLYPTHQNWKFLHIRNGQYTVFHISNFWSRRSLGRKPRCSSPLGFDFQTNSDHNTEKIKLYSVRALKRYLNEKNLIHGREMAAISKFGPQIFETYLIKSTFH